MTTASSTTPESVSPIAPVQSSLGKKGRRKNLNSNTGAALLFLLPMLLVFGYFSWGPIVRGLMLSLQSYKIGKPTKWVGFKNFDYVLSNPLLGTAVTNTLWYTFLALFIGMPVPLIMAVLISEARRFRGLLMVIAYIPVVLPTAVAALLWRTLYDPSANGVLNKFLGFVGISPQPWLNATSSAMPSIVVEATWASFGGATIIYIAALVGVRLDLYEAAELEGAGVLSRIWHVTLPQLRPVILVMILLQIIGTMQVFAEPWLMTGGGPANSTTTILILIYNYAFISKDYTAAAALSALLVLGLLVISGVYSLLTRRWSSS